MRCNADQQCLHGTCNTGGPYCRITESVLATLYIARQVCDSFGTGFVLTLLQCVRTAASLPQGPHIICQFCHSACCRWRRMSRAVQVPADARVSAQKTGDPLAVRDELCGAEFPAPQAAADVCCKFVVERNHRSCTYPRCRVV